MTTECDVGLLRNSFTRSFAGMTKKVAHVGNRLVVRPVAQLGDVLNYVVPADGLIENLPVRSRKGESTPRTVRVQLLRDRRLIDQEIAVAGCDPAVFLAGEYLRRQMNAATVVGWTMGSGAALEALKLSGEGTATLSSLAG